ncbi:hypothetical protein WME76_02020 [Sorangium sp. So ce119]|uniref:hypothetical protein n=1 Tax=Sorangium sp. So ce119 TaxID=3133279 RepID=UPI003F5D896E
MKSIRVLARVLTGLAIAAASFSVLGTPPADAREPTPAAACLFETDYVGDYGVSADGISNRSGGFAWSTARNIYCPIPTALRDSGQPIFVDGYDGNNETSGQVTARVCMTSWAGGAAVCANPGLITQNTETGFFIGRSLDAANINHLRNPALADNYPVLVISIPRGGTGGNSRIAGIQTW